MDTEQEEMWVVKIRSGWAVATGEPARLIETKKTKRAAQEWITRCVAARADNAAFAKARAERIAAAGWQPTELADILPGQEFAYLKPNGDLSPGRPVARVELLESGAAMIYHSDHRPGYDAFTLATGAFPTYTRNGATQP